MVIIVAGATLDRDVVAPVATGHQRHHRGGDTTHAGIAASSASTRSNNAWDCSLEYPFSDGEIEKVTRFSARIPRSTRVRFTKLLRNSPVGISSTADTVTCAHTNACRTRAVPRVPEDCPASSFNVTPSDDRAASHAGYSPNSRPVSSESAMLNASTGHSRSLVSE